jgi:hypothetical protein
MTTTGLQVLRARARRLADEPDLQALYRRYAEPRCGRTIHLIFDAVEHGGDRETAANQVSVGLRNEPQEFRRRVVSLVRDGRVDEARRLFGRPLTLADHVLNVARLGDHGCDPQEIATTLGVPEHYVAAIQQALDNDRDEDRSSVRSGDSLEQTRQT